jgi:hypothetical protein
MIDGKRCEIEHFGVTKYKSQNRYGVVADEEAPKKSLTDAIKKCLSMLGFCAEVYQGKFDDEYYKQSADARSQAEESDERDELVQSEVDSITEWTKKEIKSAESVDNFSVFMKAMANIGPKIIMKCKPLGINPNPIIALCKASIETRKQLETKEGTE